MALVQLGKHRFRAAITGRILDAVTTEPVPGARVQITSMPAAFQAILGVLQVQHGSAWSSMTRRPDLASSGLDGMFLFGDLPDGAYTLAITLPGGDARYGATTAGVTVSHAPDGAVTTPFVAATLPPTAVQGTILRQVPDQGNQPPTTAPLRLALVRVRGLDVAAYSGSTGVYYLTGADPGAHTLQISAPGYAPATTTATVQKGVVVTPPTITLIPAP